MPIACAEVAAVQDVRDSSRFRLEQFFHADPPRGKKIFVARRTLIPKYSREI
jgi:hypothetical protein